MEGLFELLEHLMTDYETEPVSFRIEWDEMDN